MKKSMTMKLKIWIPLLSIVTFASGDIVQGTVTDATTNSPIYRVKVSVDSDHVVYTDRAGVFVMNTGATTILLSTVGSRLYEMDRIQSWDCQGRELGNSVVGMVRSFHRIMFPTLVLEHSPSFAKSAARSAGNILSFDQAGYLPAKETILGSQSGLAVKLRLAPTDTTPGLHPFLYSGEWQNTSFDKQTMYIVKGGKVVWSYTMPAAGELGEATLLSNGNIVFCRLRGASVITQDKKIIWNVDAPGGTEIHAVRPIGLDRVLYVQQGKPAYLRIVNIKTGMVEKQMILPVGKPDGSHMQFRRVNLTWAGTILAAHSDMDKVAEYDSASGKEIWSAVVPSIWAAARLKNGNTLVTGQTGGGPMVRELDKQGNIVWEVSPKDLPGLKVNVFQEAGRLENGNTVVCNWVGNRPVNERIGSVQVIEVTPDKRVVWAMKSWQDPNLNTASAIQLLDEPGVPENGELQR
jgi:hypothetical protein